MPQSWDVLHKRFATGVRDAVSSAADNGAELTVSDRDAYLIYAYTQYIRLLCIYNPGEVGNMLSELYKILEINGVSGSANLPSDFNFLVDLESTTNGTTLTKLEPQDFLRYKRSNTVQNPPSNTDIRYSLSGAVINYIPATISTTFEISYIIVPPNITQSGANDIVLGAEHWDTIVALAKESYYYDKMEFDIGRAMRNNAIENSPFKIGQTKE